MNVICDYLEELMDLKRTASIKFRSADGGVSAIKGHLVKMGTVSGRHIVQADSGLLIGTDQILEVNGRQFQNIC